MFQVVPVTDTKIDWNIYLVTMKKLLGRNVTDQLDLQKIRPDNLAAYIVTLGSMLDSELKPNEILSDAGALLQHGSQGFLMILDTDLLVEVFQTFPLNIISIVSGRLRLAIVSGNLEQWRSSIINGCSVTSDSELRSLLGTCMIHMEKSGLAPLWWNYTKQSMKDKTFALVMKK